MHDPYAYLQEQECTSPSGSVMETSYASSDDGNGSPWTGLSSIARHVAQTINKSAKSLINELAELEYEARARSHSYDINSDAASDTDRTAADHHHNHSRSRNHSQTTTILPLPWEICFQSTDEKLKISIVQKEDEPLKAKILSLSKNESIFTGPFNDETTNEHSSPKRTLDVHNNNNNNNNSGQYSQNEVEESIFTLDDSRVMLIRRLLEIDTNLGCIHAKVSGRSTIKEKIFWMNYFYHCEKLREQREKEINDQSLRRALHDDELDAELVGRPPASCTGFYPRTGKLSLSLQATHSSDYGCGNGIGNVSGEDHDHIHAYTNSNSNRIIPALPNMFDSSDDFVIVNEIDGVEDDL